MHEHTGQRRGTSGEAAVRAYHIDLERCLALAAASRIGACGAQLEGVSRASSQGTGRQHQVE
jgi:hypothetical protein